MSEHHDDVWWPIGGIGTGYVDYVLSDGPPVYSAAFKPGWKRIP